MRLLLNQQSSFSIIEHHRASYSTIQHHTASYSIIQHHSALEHDRVWLSMTEHDWAWLSMTEHDWAWMSMTEHDWAWLSMTNDWQLTHLWPIHDSFMARESWNSVLKTNTKTQKQQSDLLGSLQEPKKALWTACRAGPSAQSGPEVSILIQIMGTGAERRCGQSWYCQGCIFSLQ